MARGANTPPSKGVEATPETESNLVRAIETAMAHLHAGRLEEAKAAFQEIRRRYPGSAGALHFLGAIAHQEGDHNLAVELMTKAIDEDSRLHVFHGNLGEVYRALGRYDEAIACCRRALEIFAVYPEALNTLGAALHAKGELEEAETVLRRAVEFKPNMAAAHANLGNVLGTRGRHAEAVAAYREAIRLNPSFAGALDALGTTWQARGRPELAAECYQRALEINPDDAPTLSNLGATLRSLGKTDEAVDCLRKAVRLRPDFGVGQTNLGMVLLVTGEIAEAEACYRTALRLDRDNLEALAGMAKTLTVKGDFDGADTYWRRVLAVDPHYGRAYAGLALSRTFQPGDAEIESLERRLQRETFTDDERREIHFALGKAYDDVGTFDRAIEHFRAGNGLKDIGAGFDGKAFGREIDCLIATFDQAFFDARVGWGSDSERPLFIVGMPRSGTTLVEQILASHPQVFGAGEFEALGELARSLGSTADGALKFPDAMANVDEAAVRRLADRYLDRVSPLSRDALRVTDKMPDNYLRLGLVAAMFPHARVVHCRRDPLDLCLSCYFSDFRTPHPYAYDLADLGAYHREYTRLMTHWRAVLPLPTLDVCYDDLVGDPGEVTRGMIDFCGLEWDDACLRFYEHDRPVWTLSGWQVRQPIYRTSVGRWRNYDAHLGPLKTALGISDPGKGS